MGMDRINIHNSLPCDAGRLIPHEPPMLLVQTLVEKKEDGVEGSVSVVEAEIPRSGPFVCDGRLLPEYYIEVMAQAIAASDGYPQVEGKHPATGLLTGIDGFSWTGKAQPGDLIRITLCKTFEFGSAFIFSGSIQCGDEQIAEGQLKIWRVEE